MRKRSRKYQEAFAKVDREKLYSPREALQLVKETSYANFDETVEIHFRLGVDPRHADQQVRSTVRLPHGLGKEVQVLVFAAGEAARIAEEAGADYVADSDEWFQRIEQGWTDFDAALAVPQMMSKVGRLGKMLGPRGLMPNPKTGTVIQGEDLPRAITEARQGRVEYRLDKTGNVHLSIGKVSFSKQQLLDNLTAILEAIVRAKPGGAKGQYIQRITMTSTMGPGIKLDINQALVLKSE